MRSGKSPRRMNEGDGSKKPKPSPQQSGRGRVIQPNKLVDENFQDSAHEKEDTLEGLSKASQSLHQSRRVIADGAHHDTSLGKQIDGSSKLVSGTVGPGISPFAGKGPKKQTAGQVAQSLLNCINAIRTNPKKFAGLIEKVYIEDLDNEGVLISRNIQTTEGKNAFIEAKLFLESVEPVHKLKADEGLTVAAYLHSKYMAETNMLTHSGPEKQNVADRIEEFGTILAGDMAENILGSEELDVEEWTLNFVVDDSFPQRGHRKNLFSADLELVGVGVTAADGLWYADLNFTSVGYRAKQHKVAKAVEGSKSLRKYLADLFHTQD